MVTKSWLRDCWRLQWRILTLQASREELLNMRQDTLIWGMFFTVLAGIGRAWDLPDANVIVRAGVPSFLYIFALSLFLWLFIGALRPKNWSYPRLLTYVSMTAMPGLLYAVPLEMMMSREAAITGNTCLLIIVACWRVLMLGAFLLKTTDMRWSHTVVALFLPLFTIINVLIFLNYFERTFEAMGGIRRYLIVVDQKVVDEEKRKGEEEEKRTGHYTRETSRIFPVTGKDGKPSTTVFQMYSYSYGADATVPAGYKEIAWDDPTYLPMDPLMMFLRPLGTVSKIGAPVLFLYYLGAVILSAYDFVRSRRRGMPPQKNTDEN